MTYTPVYAFNMHLRKRTDIPDNIKQLLLPLFEQFMEAYKIITTKDILQVSLPMISSMSKIEQEIFLKAVSEFDHKCYPPFAYLVYRFCKLIGIDLPLERASSPMVISVTNATMMKLGYNT